MRVGVDVSPLVQTRAGTARYLRAVAELDRRDDVEVRSSPSAAPAASDARAGRCSGIRSCSAASATPTSCTARRTAARCARALPLVVTVHDLAVAPSSRGVQPLDAHVQPARRAARPARRASRRSRSRSSRAASWSSCCVFPRDEIRVVPNGVDDEFTAGGPAAEGDYVLAVGTLEPRKNLPRLAEAARRTGVELRVVGARGWGDVQVAANGVRWLGERRRRRARAAVPRRALRRLPVALRGLRDSGRSRRWRAARRS